METVLCADEVEEGEGGEGDDILDLAPTEIEASCLQLFATKWTEIKNIINRTQSEMRVLLAKKKEVLAELKEFMVANGLEASPLTIENKRYYIRYRVRPSKKGISETVVKHAIESLADGNHFEKSFEELTEDGTPTILEVIVRAICSATDSAATYQKEELKIDTSKPKGVKADTKSAEPKRKRRRIVVGGTGADKEGGKDRGTEKCAAPEPPHFELPTEVTNLCGRLFVYDKKLSVLRAHMSSARERLNTLTMDYQPRSRPLSQDAKRKRKQEEVDASKREKHAVYSEPRNVLAGYVARRSPEKKSVSIVLANADGTKGKYFLREKMCGAKPAFPTNMYRGVVEDVSKVLLETSQLPLDKVCDVDTMNQLKDPEVLQSMMDAIMDRIDLYKEANVTKVRAITLDKAPTGKKKQQQDGGEGGGEQATLDRINVVELVDDDDDGGAFGEEEEEEE